MSDFNLHRPLLNVPIDELEALVAARKLLSNLNWKPLEKYTFSDPDKPRSEATGEYEATVEFPRAADNHQKKLIASVVYAILEAAGYKGENPFEGKYLLDGILLKVGKDVTEKLGKINTTEITEEMLALAPALRDIAPVGTNVNIRENQNMVRWLIKNDQGKTNAMLVFTKKHSKSSNEDLVLREIHQAIPGDPDRVSVQYYSGNQTYGQPVFRMLNSPGYVNWNVAEAEPRLWQGRD